MATLPPHAVPPEAAALRHQLADVLVLDYGTNMPLRMLSLLCVMQSIDMTTHASGHISELMSILRLTGARDTRSPIEGRRWPASLDDATAHPGFHVRGTDRTLALDPDWVGTWMVHAGANPWQEEPEGLGCAAQAAAMLGHPGVLRASLALPQAPTVEDFVRQPVKGKPLWQLMLTGPLGAEMLEVLLEKGLDPATLLGTKNHPLAFASIEVARLYAGKGWWPRDEETLKQVQLAWQKRFSTGDITKEALSEFLHMAPLGQGAGSLSCAQELLEARLRRILLTSSSETHKTISDFQEVAQWKAADLVEVVDITKGPWRGHWPVWAAMASATGRARLRALPTAWRANLCPQSNRGQSRSFRVEGVPDLSSHSGLQWREGVPAIAWLAYAHHASSIERQALIGWSDASREIDRKEEASYWEEMAGVFGMEAATLRHRAKASLPGLAAAMISGGPRGSPASEMFQVAMKAAFEVKDTPVADILALMRATVTLDNPKQDYFPLPRLIEPVVALGGQAAIEVLWCMAWSPFGTREDRQSAATRLHKAAAKAPLQLSTDTIALAARSCLPAEEKNRQQDLLALAKASLLAQAVAPPPAASAVPRPRL